MYFSTKYYERIMSKDKNKKKKIGWWRWVAKWVFSPLMQVGRDAVAEAIPDEHKPLENLSILSIDIAEDMIKIHTDLDTDNKQQVKDWWSEKQSDVLAVSMELIGYAAGLIMARMAKQGISEDELPEKDKRVLRMYKASK